MTIQIKAPTFPESVADGTIANWLKKEGESVNQDEVIAEIETDKVVLEVLAQSDGVITKLRGFQIVKIVDLRLPNFKRVSMKCLCYIYAP